MNGAENKLKILFLCTGNSCRSQMAEGWARELKGDSVEPWSAGTKIKELDPLAVRVMEEMGVDISGHRSKYLDDLGDIEFDWVVTVCSEVHESCPIFPGKTRLVHAGFDDPPRLALEARSEEEAIEIYRRVRDEIREFIEKIPDVLES
ncbi:arsenate reductase ArsC [bacterium]|nr:MAG: arsenate reductase ArsC [bacterium]